MEMRSGLPAAVAVFVGANASGRSWPTWSRRRGWWRWPVPTAAGSRGWPSKSSATWRPAAPSGTRWVDLHGVCDPSMVASAAFAVAEICRRLGGIPLAIELAAARTRGCCRRARSRPGCGTGSGCWRAGRGARRHVSERCPPGLDDVRRSVRLANLVAHGAAAIAV